MQLNLYPKPKDKVSLVVQHTKLASAGAVTEFRAQWKAALAALAAFLERR